MAAALTLAPPITERSGASESLVTSPAHTRSQSAARSSWSCAPGAAPRIWPQKLAPCSASRVRIASCSAPSAGSRSSQPGASSGSWSAKHSRIRPSRAPSAPAPTQMTSPAVHSSSSIDGRKPATRTGSTSASIVEATSAVPDSTPRVSTRASMPRRPAGMSCHAVRNRAKASCSTGSTSLRSAASDRRRSWRRTSTSQNSRDTPSGRNSPTTRRSSPSRAASAPAIRSGGAPKRLATSAVRNGPWVRAYRPTISSSGRATGSVNAIGNPSGSEQPNASR